MFENLLSLISGSEPFRAPRTLILTKCTSGGPVNSSKRRLKGTILYFCDLREFQDPVYGPLVKNLFGLLSRVIILIKTRPVLDRFHDSSISVLVLPAD